MNMKSAANFDFTGRVAIITGAGRGIGRTMALDFGRAGAAVVLVARTASQLESAAEEIRSAGGRARAMPGDVTDAASVRATVDATLEEFGSVDILINNAGDNILGTLPGMDPEVWWQQIEVNIKGPYLYSRAVLPSMLERNWGRIINISSINGKRGAAFCTAYCAGKHGVIGLTRALAIDVAKKGITVNAICPGWIETDLTDRTFAQRAELFGVKPEDVRRGALQGMPQGRSIEEEEVSPTALFLASEAASRITGQAINVCGGAVMW